MEYKINDLVRDKKTGEIGVIRDKMFSEAKKCFIYAVEIDDTMQYFARAEELEEYSPKSEFKIETQIADNVVIGIIYEVENGEKYEVCRGHGHIIHEGAVGIAQACSYAYKRAFCEIDDGIYLKQRRHK